MSIVIVLAQEQREQVLSKLLKVHESRNRAANAACLDFVPFEESDFAALILNIDKADGLLALIAHRIEAAEDVKA